jgi:PiT family inorganic phosphate transporter
LYGMLASLLAAGTWLLVATFYGWPVSTTHSIVGAVIGFSAICVGIDSVKWGVVGHIALSWVVTPLLSAVLAFLLFNSVQQFIFRTHNPIERARFWIPVYIFLVVMVIVMVTLTQGLKHRWHISMTMAFWTSLFCSAVVAMVGFALLSRIKPIPGGNHHREQFVKVERMFSVLMVFTAAAMAFAHGSNDVANAVGPLAAVVRIIHHGTTQVIHIPMWVMMLGALGIVTGLVTYGFKVIATIGSNITQLTPSRGFAAQLATASTVVLSSGLGLPVSTTQVMVGAVLGVGLARGVGALNVRVIFNIFMSWVVTLPAGAVLAIVYFYVLSYAFKWFVH